MSILKIARMGQPVLFQQAEPVADPGAPEIRRLVENMIETLADAGGVGLAAPQVHESKRVVIFHIPEGRDGEEGEGQPLTVMINPVIELQDDEQELGWEACLSLPEFMGMVPRYARIRYRWTTLEGGTEERTASGFHARAVQHECDHLDGILFPMRITDLRNFGYAEEINRNPPAPEDKENDDDQDREEVDAADPEQMHG